MTCQIRQVQDAQEKSAICKTIIKALPAWFGISESNQSYIKNITACDVFAAYVDGHVVGAIALKYHFNKTAEIWWMGILPGQHGKGVGTKLFERARQWAVQAGSSSMIVSTLSDRSDDEHYARTREFYLKQGFKPLVEFNEDDPRNPMMWMTLSLS